MPPKNGNHSGEMPDIPCPPKKKHISEEQLISVQDAKIPLLGSGASVSSVVAPKKPRLVFTDLQRRTLQAIFKVSANAFILSVGAQILNPFITLQETKRPSKEMQVTIARQLGLEPTTVGNFFMNARRRSLDKWKEEGGYGGGAGGGGDKAKGSPKENGSSSLSSVNGMSDDEHDDDLDDEAADHSNEMMHNFSDEILESEPYNQQHCNYDLL